MSAQHHHVRGRHSEHNRVLLAAAMQHHKATARQDVGAHLCPKIAEVGDEGRRQLFAPLGRVNLLTTILTLAFIGIGRSS